MNILEDLKAKKKVDFKILFDYFSKDFPLLKDFKNTEQDPIWHAEGNVYIHTEMVINSLYDILKQEDISGEEFRILILSALFHDIAKPITTKEREREGRIQIVSPKHEYMGMSYSFYRLLNYDLSLDEIKMIVSLIGYHQVPKLLVVRDEGFEKYLELSLNTNLRLIYLLEKADMTGRTCSDLDIQLEYLELFKLYSLEYGLWKSSLKQKEIKDMCDNDFVYYRGVKNLFEKEIFQIEEANAKYYKESKNYSHVKILVALSGTGKSHYSNSIDSSFNIISLDKLREKHKTRNKKQKDGCCKNLKNY